MTKRRGARGRWRRQSVGETARRRRGLDLAVPYCPKCGSTLVQTWIMGPDLQILVDAARPQDGVLAVLVRSDDLPSGALDDPTMVMCALCEMDCGARPRQHGHPLYRALQQALGADRWIPAAQWEVEDLRTDWTATHLRRLVDAHEEELTGEAPFDYRGRRDEDPPGRGAPEEPEAADGQALDQCDELADALEAVRAARRAEAAAVERLRQTLRRDHAAGAGTRELARRAAGVMSRPTVLAALRTPPGGQGLDHLSGGTGCGALSEAAADAVLAAARLVKDTSGADGLRWQVRAADGTLLFRLEPARAPCRWYTLDRRRHWRPHVGQSQGGEHRTLRAALAEGAALWRASVTAAPGQ